MKNTLILAAALLGPAWAGDAPAPRLNCDQPGLYMSGFVSSCVMKEVSTAFLGSLTAETPLGSISVVGWDQPDVLVRARVEAAAPTKAEADDLAAEIQPNVVGTSVSVAAPARTSKRNWSVSFEILMPRAANLSLHTSVGSISIADMKGTIRFVAKTGSVSLDRLAGDVQGSTNVGSISIVLDGDHWDGDTLAVKTNVGSTALKVPAFYSAHFSLTTNIGKIDATALGAPTYIPTGFKLGGNVTLDTGSGGATIAAETNVGSIAVQLTPTSNP